MFGRLGKEIYLGLTMYVWARPPIQHMHILVSPVCSFPKKKMQFVLFEITSGKLEQTVIKQLVVIYVVVDRIEAELALVVVVVVENSSLTSR